MDSFEAKWRANTTSSQKTMANAKASPILGVATVWMYWATPLCEAISARQIGTAEYTTRAVMVAVASAAKQSTRDHICFGKFPMPRALGHN